MQIGNLLIVTDWLDSTLWATDLFAGQQANAKLWLDYNLIGKTGLLLLQLQPDGMTPASNLVGGIYPQDPETAHWGESTQELTSLGWNTVFARLDWRRPFDNQVSALVAQIRQLTPVAPCYAVAHGKGGLILRAALAQLQAAGELQRVVCAAGLGVPHGGTWDAVTNLVGLSRNYSFLKATVSRYGGIPVANISSQPLLQAMQSWPGLYNLLPAPGFPQWDPETIAAIYDPIDWLNEGFNIQIVWLTNAQNWWKALPAIPSGFRWLDVWSDFYATYDGTTTGTVPNNVSQLTTNAGGDTVVTSASARSGSPESYQTYQTHDEYVSDEVLWPALTRWLTGTPAANLPPAPQP